MFKRLVSAALVFGCTALAPPAAAQTLPCLPRVALIDTLQSRQTQTLLGGGLQTDQRLIELWRSDETGTFTIILTRPDGVSCILATGHHWHQMPPVPKGVTG